MLHTVVTMIAALWALEDFRVDRSGRIQLSSAFCAASIYFIFFAQFYSFLASALSARVRIVEPVLVRLYLCVHSDDPKIDAWTCGA
jgi:hypothetical protein